MKSSLPMAAAVLAALAASAVGVETAQAEPCVGPFRQCAYAVGAWCERDRSGQVINYWDHPGNVMMFERCVGDMFEAAGQPNPYKTGVVTTGSRRKGGRALTMPRSELHYPVTPSF